MGKGRNADMVKWFKPAVLVATAMLLTIQVGAVSTDVFQSYNYSYWGEEVMTPNTYQQQRNIRAEDVGLKSWKEPKDFYVSSGRDIYVADTGNNRIVVLDGQFRLKEEITVFTGGAENLTMKSPTGLFVTADNTLYIADTGNNRVIQVTPERNIVREYLRPSTDIAFSGIDFLPLKVVVDDRGFVYTLCQGLYQGAACYDLEGNFFGYFASNPIEVSIDLMMRMLWKRVMTREQIEKLEKAVPQEFSNLDIDAKGFIYTCTSSATAGQLKRFNPAGKNIFPSRKLIQPSYASNYGDLDTRYFQGEVIRSRFTDICSDEDGYVFALDFTKGRVFNYNGEGYLIGVFGGKGFQVGTMGNPVAIDTIGEDILILDSAKNHLVLYSPTEYLHSIRRAYTAYNEGDYERAKVCWEEVLSRNGQLEQAYSGIGRVLYNMGDYVQAIRYFERGNDKSGYNKTLRYLRKDMVIRVFPPLMVAVVILSIALVLYKNRRRILAYRGRGKRLRGRGA